LEGRRRGIRIDPSDLLLEIVSIVVAILLALAVNHWQEEVAHQRTLHESLVNIRHEIADNRAQLLNRMPLHARVTSAYLSFASKHQHDASVTFPQAYAMFVAAAPRGFNPFHGDSIAWQIAGTSQALSYMPYATRAALTKVYETQTGLYSVELRFIDAAVSPSAPSRDYFSEVFAASLWLGDVKYDESALLKLYDDALKMLPAS
jgi:hypothetical protein